jgi:transposase
MFIKNSIRFCVKAADGQVLEEGKLAATRKALTAWAQARKEPWVGAMEATLFTGWIYDHLRQYAQELKVGHPLMMKAIAASKKKNDRMDARKVADLLRCDLLPECYIATGPICDLRRMLRYRLRRTGCAALLNFSFAPGSSSARTGPAGPRA